MDIGQIHSSGSPEIFTLRVNTNINVQCLSCNNLKLKITLTLNGAPYCLTPCSTVNTELDFQQVGLRWSPGHIFGLLGSVSDVVMGSGAGSVACSGSVYTDWHAGQACGSVDKSGHSSWFSNNSRRWPPFKCSFLFIISTMLSIFFLYVFTNHLFVKTHLSLNAQKTNIQVCRLAATRKMFYKYICTQV